MADTIKPVVFQEGAPLDPNELNKLSDNINTVYKLGITLQNATTNTSESIRRVPVIDAGRIEVSGLTKGTALPLDVNWNAGLFTDFLTSKETYPYITATLSGSSNFLDKNRGIQLSVVYDKNPKIILRSDVMTTETTFYVNWTAVAFRVVS